MGCSSCGGKSTKQSTQPKTGSIQKVSILKTPTKTTTVKTT